MNAMSLRHAIATNSANHIVPHIIKFDRVGMIITCDQAAYFFLAFPFVEHGGKRAPNMIHNQSQQGFKRYCSLNTA